MKDNNVVDFSPPAGIDHPLTDLLHGGAKQLIHQDVEVEAEETPAARAS